MTRRVAIVLLTPLHWAPPGIDAAAWRAALAEDLVDLLNTLAEIDGAVAYHPGDRALATAVSWPTTRRYEIPAAIPAHAFAAAASDGYAQAAVLAPDVPDLPGLLIGKLMRPITSRPVALAPTSTGSGCWGVAASLPAVPWLPEEFDLDRADIDALRTAAPRAALVGVAPAWHRLRGPKEFAALNPALEAWEATRALLAGAARG